MFAVQTDTKEIEVKRILAENFDTKEEAQEWIDQRYHAIRDEAYVVRQEW